MGILSSSYFKGGPDGSFCWNDQFKSSSNLQDDAITQTLTTVESTHTGSIDAETPRNLPNESIGSWTPRNFLVNQPHSYGVYGSKTSEELDSVVLQLASNAKTQLSLNETSPLRREGFGDASFCQENKPTNESSQLNGSVMSVVTESCNSSFFRDMNDSLYSPERDLRRADLRRSPSRKRDKIRRSREGLSQCFDVSVSDKVEGPNALSSVSLSHYYHSSRAVGRSKQLNSETDGVSNPKLAKLWKNFPKAGQGQNRTGKTPNPKSSRDEIDCFSQLICNPVQYFARQWIESVQEAANLTVVPDTDLDSTSYMYKKSSHLENVPKPSWRSKRATGGDHLGSRKATSLNEIQQLTLAIVNKQKEDLQDAENKNKNSKPLSEVKNSAAAAKTTQKKSNSRCVQISNKYEDEEVRVCESRRTVSVQTPKELLLNYHQTDNDFELNSRRSALQSSENIRTRRDNQLKSQVALNVLGKSSLTWFHSLSDKENGEEEKRETRGKRGAKSQENSVTTTATAQSEKGSSSNLHHEMQSNGTPRGTSTLSLQDAFLLNKADVVRKSRERQRMISIRSAERQMQEIYAEKRQANYNLSTRSHHGLPQRDLTEVWAAKSAHKTTPPRWASVIPAKDANHHPSKKPITRSEMKLRTERLYQSLPEVQERDRIRKQRGQIQSNRIMLDSYKSKMKDQQRAKVSRSKTLVVRHY